MVTQPLRDALRMADAPPLRHGFMGNFALGFEGWQGEQAAGMPGAEPAFGHHQLRRSAGSWSRRSEIEDGGAVFAGSAADLLGLRSSSRPRRSNAVAVSMGLRSSRWMFSMRVISRRRSSGISRTTTGTLVDAGELGGAPAAFAGDELVAVSGLADHQGLNDAVGADGLRQFREALGLEDAARLEGIGVDQVDGDDRAVGSVGGAGSAGGLRWRAGWQEGAEALTERLARIVGFVHGRGSLWRVGCSFPRRGSGGRR